jgi:glutamate 5-kinase
LVRARRVVVKVGTNVVSRDGTVALGRLGHLVESLAALVHEGRQVMLVSSGAVGLGMQRLGYATKPRGRIDQQACAAVGQGLLMGLYDGFFQRLGLSAAQVLLTEDDFHHRARSVALAATLERLLARGAVPVLNENDVVSPDPRAIFGDNDRLAALVASHVDADALVLLSDVDGVYTAPPGTEGARRLSTFTGQSVTIGALSSGGRGGMGAKVEAATLSARAGVPTVIASGGVAGTLRAVLAGDDVGTVFPAVAAPSRRRRWIAYATAPLGTLHVNRGARDALVERGASLLAPGIESVDGEFEEGAVVRICCEGAEIARGLSRRSSQSLGEPEPARSKPVVHRDDLVVHEVPED